jgi:hypothetical protein
MSKIMVLFLMLIRALNSPKKLWWNASYIMRMICFTQDSKTVGVSTENISFVHGSLSETGKRLTRPFVGNIVREGNQSTMPIAISRGLHSGGRLSAAEGGWGSDSDFIGF